MATAESEGDAQKLRFGPWLLNAIDSGLYQGLCWTNPAQKVFRIPWKHNARKDVTSSDIEIFKAWAQASGRYEGSPEDPAKWKTNFRCALRSTHMFTLLKDNSKNSDDPHKVFAVTSAAPQHGQDTGLGVPVVDAPPQQQPQQQPQLELNHHDVALQIVPRGSTTAPTTQSLTQEDLDMLQWVLQHCNISTTDPTPSPWPPAGDVLHNKDALLQPGPGQGSCLPPTVFQEWRPVAEQPPLGAYGPSEHMLLGEQTIPGAVSLPCHTHPAEPEPAVPVLSAGEELLFHPNANPAPPTDDTGIPPHLDVTIYYRGKTVHQEVVNDRQCLLTYQSLDPVVVLQPGQHVLFPSPEGLADSKQRQYTEELLLGVGLRLEQRAGKLFATRLKKCKVFWALSQQLDNGKPPPNLLCRDQETSIFDFHRFCTDLRDFRDNRRERSPDFTIFLCFGQCFSNCKPKESKLILVKLVPKFCEHWYEQVQRQGASSLNSGNVSLQLSDSFSLYELIEQYNMQID
ncbi:interferon regulatory factor 7 [Aythya fuligula]|uniref:Interferon regulatory factor 7 n=1 Tax=Aythya fuligula TaxID=219594 RepID=A0A6J3D3I5_AYTFU|nr:interferon regulatory factor 7 [Aythya fuligula]